MLDSLVRDSKLKAQIAMESNKIAYSFWVNDKDQSVKEEIMRNIESKDVRGNNGKSLIFFEMPSLSRFTGIIDLLTYLTAILLKKQLTV